MFQSEESFFNPNCHEELRPEGKIGARKFLFCDENVATGRNSRKMEVTAIVPHFLNSGRIQSDMNARMVSVRDGSNSRQ